MAQAPTRARKKARPGTGRRKRGGERRWNPNHPGVYIWRNAGARLDAVVRHEANPYTEQWAEASGMAGLFAIAGRYLALVNRRLRMPREWLDDLVAARAADGVRLRWLEGRKDPRDSHWVRRYQGLEKRSGAKRARQVDRSAVLLAGLCVPSKSDKDGLFRLYGGQGLRIVVQVGQPQGGMARARITGVRVVLPGIPRAGTAAAPWHALVRELGAEALVTRIRRDLRGAFGLAEGHVVAKTGFRLPEARAGESPLPIVLAKTAPTEKARAAGQRDSYALVARLKFDPASFKTSLAPLHKRPMMACVHADANVFVQDPVSKNGAGRFTALRPNRSWKVLDPERVNQVLGDLPAGGLSGTVKLIDPDPGGDPDFRVTNSALVDHPLSESAAKEVPASSDAHVRSDEFAAVNAFHHTSRLFERMRSYGLHPAEYFRHVTRPVDVRYRSSIRPGWGDGRTVNAQVRWILHPDDSAAGCAEVCLALGDLQGAPGNLPNNLPAAVERSPLGVAADPRWSWHEYCHVLIAAAIGELEFGFAHSAGDAMAAILSDPDSMLARDATGAAANGGKWRGVTYPWVQIPRRHDRDVQRGWGWTGILNRRERYFAVEGMLDKRGYWTEQLMSTALFRLYRAIGGDCEQGAGGIQVPDAQARREAADYAVYLVMRAIQLLGAGDVVPSTGAECFVEALRLADSATDSVPGPGGYAGGSVGKVVQWAFERQGLYAIPLPGTRVSGPDELANVDLHIEDRRLKPEAPYSPVDLNGDAWHAHGQALKVPDPAHANQANKIWVRVENRGRRIAASTSVSVWAAPLSAAGAIPPYPDAAWQPIGPAIVKDVPPAAGATTGKERFGPFVWTPPTANQRYAILAAASCAEDPSNIDPALGLPCATVPGLASRLVACDNNLALRVVTAN